MSTYKNLIDPLLRTEVARSPVLAGSTFIDN